MSVNYTAHFNTRATKQSEPIPGRTDMVANNAGGYVFKVGPWDQFLRFLILGSEGGTYYVSEKSLIKENATNVIKCIQEDTQKAVDLILDVSLKGRAVKQDATIFALALACAFAPEKQKPIAYKAISSVCRTGTHLFTFVNYIQNLRGWSRGLRNGVAKFYLANPLEKVELQVVKYRNREGFTHRDVLRLAHPATKEFLRNELFKYAVGKTEFSALSPEQILGLSKSFPLIGAYEKAKTLDPKTAKGTKELVSLIKETGLPREGLPTEFLGKEEVWAAMLPDMPMTALVRNLGKISSLGMTKSNLSDATVEIVAKLKNEEAIKKSRIHPMQILVASKMYAQGHGDKGSLSWTPNAKILDALNDAFYLAFGNVEATGKNMMLALDVSGSMSGACAGSSVIDCRTAAAAMAMITARVEQNYDIIGFTNGGKNYFGSTGASHFGYAGVSQLAITPKQRLDDIVKYLSKLGFGGTDCSLPMQYALKNKIKVDTFVVYTDSETWHGNIHPVQALEKYRKEMNPNAKLVVVGMNSNGFTIADPKDSGMLDVVGFDTATPNLISQFTTGFLSS